MTTVNLALNLKKSIKANCNGYPTQNGNRKFSSKHVANFEVLEIFLDKHRFSGQFLCLPCLAEFKEHKNEVASLRKKQREIVKEMRTQLELKNKPGATVEDKKAAEAGLISLMAKAQEELGFSQEDSKTLIDLVTKDIQS